MEVHEVRCIKAFEHTDEKTGARQVCEVGMLYTVAREIKTDDEGLEWVHILSTAWGWIPAEHFDIEELRELQIPPATYDYYIVVQCVGIPYSSSGRIINTIYDLDSVDGLKKYINKKLYQETLLSWKELN